MVRVSCEHETFVETDRPDGAKGRREGEHLAWFKHHLHRRFELAMLRLKVLVAPLCETRPRWELAGVGLWQLVFVIKVGEAIAEHMADVLEQGLLPPGHHSISLSLLCLLRRGSRRRRSGEEAERRELGATGGERLALLLGPRPTLVGVQRVVEGLLRDDHHPGECQEPGDLQVDDESAGAWPGHALYSTL